MKKMYTIIALTFAITLCKAQIPNPALIGYWHNWSDVNAPYIQLDGIDNRYNVIEVAFAVPTSSSNMTMVFTPVVVSQSVFITKVQTLQSQGKKVLISIGGANASIDLTTTTNTNAFVNSMTTIINTYGFDGIDIDIENGNSILITGGTISAPTNTAQINLISAIKQIMVNYRATHTQKLLLTMAPETAYVQGGQSSFGNIWGGYLPIINGLRDSIDVLQVQLYNSGSMYGIDRNVYTQGTVDFIIAMTEAVIQGFNTSGGMFAGLPASKVAVGLPACASAAGGGFVDTANVKSAINYLRGTGPRPGSYILNQIGGYPTLRGMMTWSVNWDAVNTCATIYQYAANYQNIFGTTPGCSITSGLSTTPSTNSAVLSWSNTGAVSYNLQYKLNSASLWITISSATNSYTLTGLNTCSAYTFRVQSVCSSTSSAYSSAASFTTTGCPVTYCTSYGTNTSKEYINKITLGTINNTSGNNNGYGNYTGLSTNLTGNTTVNITLSPGYIGSSRKEAWDVYIDYNRNGSFNDNGEKVVTTTGQGTLIKPFTVPASAMNGSTRMRVQMKYNVHASGPCVSYTYGEVEDYNVFIGGNVFKILTDTSANEFKIPAADNSSFISIYPNPFSLQTTIAFNEEQRNTTIIIVDVNGKEIRSINFSGKQLTIEKGDMKAGIYFVQTIDQQKRICYKKIIVQ